jgi:hypothetical protein
VRLPHFDAVDVAYFASLGPALSGILKPDVVAPGAAIVSVLSGPDGSLNHDEDAVDAMIMDGTSMATHPPPLSAP